MQYTFTKELIVHHSSSVGRLISRNRYCVYNTDGLVCQYFKSKQIDYFYFIEEEEINIYSIVNSKNNLGIINKISNEKVGSIKINKEQIEGCFAKLILNKMQYDCFTLNIEKTTDATHEAILITNEKEQVYIHFIKKRKKITDHIFEELNGTIEMQSNSILLLSVSFALLEEFLFF